MARNSEGDDVDDEADKSDVDTEVQPLRMDADNLRTVLMKELPPIENEAQQKQIAKKSQHQGALNLVNDIWGYEEVQKDRTRRNCLGPMCEDRVADHIAAKKAHGEQKMLFGRTVAVPYQRQPFTPARQAKI